MKRVTTLLSTWASYLLLSLLPSTSLSTPAPAQYYPEQLVDHFGCSGCHWTQRYYSSGDHFGGPGSPIFLVLGGEGAIEPDRGLYYGFVTHVLAKKFNAYVLQPEHRFYGSSQPINMDDHRNTSPDPRIKLLTSEQALLDAIRLLKHIKSELGCGSGADYCPVITVGGSYPGFLSAMARLVYPDEIDISYAASAPMLFYAQTVGQQEYYQHISAVADQAHAGCADNVRSVLLKVKDIFMEVDDFAREVSRIGICEGTVPSYIRTAEAFMDEIVMIAGYTFANDNMAYYPPSNQTKLYRACEIFSLAAQSAETRLREFLLTSLVRKPSSCLDMRTQLPTGPRATISSGDWSGVGTGRDGESWDFQTCTLLVEAIGFDAETSMFPDRPWSLSWLEEHCARRFAGAKPRPYELVRKWKWDTLKNASRILFTNGLNDGWSVSGIRHNVSENVLAINFPNGAHHSDLRDSIPSAEVDTPDVWDGMQTIERILGDWINHVHAEQRTGYLRQTHINRDVQ